MAYDILLNKNRFDKDALVIFVPIHKDGTHLFWIRISVFLGFVIVKNVNDLPPVTIFTTDPKVRSKINHVMRNVYNNSRSLNITHTTDTTQNHHEYTIGVNSSGPVKRCTITEYSFLFDKDTYKLLKGRFNG